MGGKKIDSTVLRDSKGRFLPGSQPRTKIDWTEFDKLCFMGATLEELASWFDCDIANIWRAVKREKGMPFAKYYAQKEGKGKISLRRKQMQVALSGDRVMLIWLGKQRLGQKDTPQVMAGNVTIVSNIPNIPRPVKEKTKRI